MGNWDELPADILVLIAKQLTLLEDLIIFGGVCRSWRSVAIKDIKGSKRFPWLMLSNKDKPDEKLFISQRRGNVACRVNLPELRGKHRLETLGWLVTIGNGDIDLLHPFTRVQISCPRLNMNESKGIEKAVLSSSPEQSEDFVLMVVYDLQYLAFWRHGDESWTEMGVPMVCFEDIIFYEGLFYGATSRGMVFAFGILGPDQTHQPLMVLDRPDTFRNCIHYLVYLVVSEGVIILVGQDQWTPNFCDDDDQTFRFQVFEATLTEKGKWVEVTSLGDKALFLGDNASVAVDATRFQGIKANCIYYADKYWECYKQRVRRHTGVYCLEDGSKSHCCEEQYFNLGCAPLWVNPPSF